MSEGIETVIKAGLCIGCGLCVTRDGDSMRLGNHGVMVPTFGSTLPIADNRSALALCPALSLRLEPEKDVVVDPDWGPLVGVRTGWATDSEVRFQGSSGGAISALLIYLLESKAVDFVAHVRPSYDQPLQNVLVKSRSREEVLAGAGSRYAPVSALQDIDNLFASGERFAFVGKPCDIAGLRNYLRRHASLAPQLAVAISFMCAGLPGIEGTHEVLQALGVPSSELDSFRYRGNGWPGEATATLKDGTTASMDYARSWGEILGKRIQLRCKLCPDGTGELADVVCADAWYGDRGYPDFTEREGRSLLLTRTSLGEQIVDAALCAGALEAQPTAVCDIAQMQPYQLERKRMVFARWLAAALRLRVRPHFSGLHLVRACRSASLVSAIRSGGGTFKRLRASHRTGHVVED